MRKGNDGEIFRHVIDIGLRMYGNGHLYPSCTVDYVMEYCRQQLRDYCQKHHQLVMISEKKRVLLLQTLVYTLRRNRASLKRLQQFVQTKDRSMVQQEELADLKEKKSTINDRFRNICQQMNIHLDEEKNESTTPMLDRQRSRQYARLDAYYQSDALTSQAYLTFVEQQHSSFNSLRSLSSMDILHWLELYDIPLPKKSTSNDDLRLAEICLFLLKEILLTLMDEVHQSTIPCDIPDVLRRRHVHHHRRLLFSGRKRISIVAMPKATVLIQGASSGIGLEFVRQLLKRPTPTHVIATSQKIADDRLAALQKEHMNHADHRLDVLELDVRHQDSFDSFGQQVEDCLNDLKRERGLDLLINCAHIWHPSNRVETSLNDVLSIDLNEVYQVNVVGPILVTKILLDKLKRGRASFGYSTSNASYSSMVVNISAELASVTNNRVGGWYAYRLSKCALNMATKNLALEFGRPPGEENSVCGLKKDEKPLLFVAMSPGVVNTQMIHEYKKLFPKNAHFMSKAESVERMLKAIEKISLEDNGKFLDFNAKPIPY